MESMQHYREIALGYVTAGAVKVAAALAIRIVGRWLIGLVGRLLRLAAGAFRIVLKPFAVRLSCHNDHYWRVYFGGNRAIREALAEAGFPAPTPSRLVFTKAA